MMPDKCDKSQREKSPFCSHFGKRQTLFLTKLKLQDDCQYLIPVEDREKLCELLAALEG